MLTIGRVTLGIPRDGTVHGGSELGLEFGKSFFREPTHDSAGYTIRTAHANELSTDGSRRPMEKNVGGYDRIGRFVIGTVLVLAGIASYAGMLRVVVGPVPKALVALVLLLIGAILLLTGYTRKCPINRTLGINTYRPRSP